MTSSISSLKEGLQYEDSSSFGVSAELSVSDSPLYTVPRSSRKEQILRRLSDYAIERLHASVLVGRDEQVQSLRETCKKICNRNWTRHLVCVAGPSGAGKTALVKTATQPFQQNQSNFWITGKFDTLQRAEPFSGLQPALIELCQQMALESDTLAPLLVDALGEELVLLTTIIPNLVDVVGSENLLSHSRVGISIKKSADRLKFALRRFVEVVGAFRPIIWHADDVQWADMASLELLVSLLSDININNLLVIASYRDEVPGDIKAFRDVVLNPAIELQESRSLCVEKIRVGPLSASDVAQMTANVLLRDPHETDTIELATLVHKRTGGNAFYITQFLPSLVKDKLLKYTTAKMAWTWDIEDVRTRSTATVNVVDLVKERIQNDSNAQTQALLVVAACLGATFSEAILTMILEGLEKHDQIFQNAFGTAPSPLRKDELTYWVGEEAIEATSGDTYAFVHDKIQEAALKSIPKPQLANLRYAVGSILFHNLSEEGLQENAFLIADLLQASPDLLPTNVQDRVRIALLNQSAGKTAIDKSAFVSAKGFFRNAISLLPADHWSSLHDLSLELYSSVAECAYACGDFSEMRKFGNVVMDLDVPILRKMQVAYVMMDADLAESITNPEIHPIKIGLQVLRELRCPLPRSNLVSKTKALAGLVQFKRMFKRDGLQIVGKLQRATDPNQIAIMKTLDKLTTAAFIIKPSIMPMLIVMSAKRTFAHGFTEYSAPALSWVGLLLGYMMGEWDAGHAFGAASVSLTKRLDVREAVPRSDLVAYVYVLHFRTPYENCKEPLLNGYKVGLATGDVETAMWCIHFYMYFQFLNGKNLGNLLHDASAYMKIAEDFGQLQQYQCTAYFCQLLENLSQGPETSLLKGNFYDEECGIKTLLENESFAHLASVNVLRLFACAFFGDFLRGADIAVEYEDSILKKLPGQPILPATLYLAGMCCYIKADATKQLRFKRYANRFRKKLKDWVRCGNPNTFHLESLLQAEFERYGGNQFLSAKLYESAILLAGRQGLTHYQAMGNERLASYWISRGNTEEALYRFQEAKRLYSDWGAKHKLEQLSTSVGEISGLPMSVVVETEEHSVSAEF